MAYKLSEGSLEVIMNGGFYDKPIMQILGSKKIQGSGVNERYRLLISDGKHSHSFAMLATQLNDRQISGEFTDFSVVKIDKFATTALTNTGKGDRRVMVIIDITIIAPGSQVGKKLGNPTTWSEESAQSASWASMQPVSRPAPAPTKPSTSSTTSGTATNLDSSVLSSQMTHPIMSLSPYQNKWVIKVRVMNKSPIRTWSNAKGEGKLFSVDLCDESGEIRATAFRNECDKFYDLLQVDKVYYISRGALKPANKQYTSIKNDYEMTFGSDTAVAPCADDAAAVPGVRFAFTPIARLADEPVDAVLDVLGVCTAAAELQEFTARGSGKLLRKRELTLVDSSGGAVALTLWGAEAEAFDARGQPLVAAKGARLAEFGGSKSLSCMASTTLRLNPDLPEAHALRGWFDSGGAAQPAVNLSARAGGGGGGEWLSFGEAEARRLGAGAKADYFSLPGVLTFVFAENAVYKACPQEGCNKKLVDQENGLFRCEKCNRDYPDFKYRLLLGANVSDASGDRRVTLFSEAAEGLLGLAAADVGRLCDYDKRAYARLFERLKFRSFLFRLRTKLEVYNDEARLKTTVVKVSPLDYKEANAKLVDSVCRRAGVAV